LAAAEAEASQLRYRCAQLEAEQEEAAGEGRRMQVANHHPHPLFNIGFLTCFICPEIEWDCIKRIVFR
jgi:hypothetical protein